ncbi:YhgE/Pip domain-containing protein [Gracilibacillus xinjiangensis]|uniref:YhgE/Pip domain-containing protein n=1 Tax=Gracilibacillus xinjiangensis TaxID=1193282 RepID=A0ABV8WT91_9BACI
MKTFKAFFKSAPTFAGIGIAVAFLLIFFIVWLTAYDGVTDRVDKLKVGIINNDPAFESNLLTDQMPFTTTSFSSFEKGKEEINNRKVQMLIVIPENFTAAIATDEGSIQYYINQAVPSLTKQTMENAANQINEQINGHVFELKKEQLSNVPETMMKSGMESLSLQSVRPEIIKLNETEGFAANMIPLLIILASFVGSMLLSLNLLTVTQKLTLTFNKWSILFSRLLIQLIVSIALAILSVSLLVLFGFEIHVSIIEILLFQTFVYLSFLCMTQMFTVLFGIAGMLLNIISFSIQLVTAGVLVPRSLLSETYQFYSNIFPATYGASGYFSIIYGGMNLAAEMKILIFIVLITFAITAMKVLFVREKKEVALNEVSNAENPV